MYLLDTNIISQTRRPDKADKRVTAWLAHTDSNNLYTSAIVMMELERGIKKPSGAALKLLSLVKAKGIQAIA